MQKRTKVIIRNILVSPFVFISFICASIVMVLSAIIEKMPYWRSLPLTDEQQKILDDKREKEKQELIAAIQKSSENAKVDLPPGYGNIIIPTQFKEVVAEYKEYN